MGHPKTDQHMYHGNLRRVEKKVEGIFEEIMAEHFSNLMKDMNRNINSSVSSKEVDFKESQTETHYNKTLKSQR